MNIHEYQAKKILQNFGIASPAGEVAYTPKEAYQAAERICQGPWMLKAQILSGARKDGYFLEKDAGKSGGIRLVRQLSQIAEEAEKMLGNTLVTIQTGPQGKRVNKVYVESFQQVTKSFYLCLTVNRISAEIVLLAADVPDGNILKLVINEPDKILHLPLANAEEISLKQIERVTKFLSLPIEIAPNLLQLITGLHRAFLELDATMIEINPVGMTAKGELLALDAKISIDDNALFRHPDFINIRDEADLDDRELQAKRNKFSYHEFDGAVGCIVNGDGLALSVMDSLKQKGNSAACFINVKGGVDKDKIANGIKLIMTNPRVEGILLNILGGFVRCNLIADGIVSAAAEAGLNVPLVVRFEGTNKDMAREILDNSKLPVIWAENEEDAVNKLLKAMEEAV